MILHAWALFVVLLMYFSYSKTWSQIMWHQITLNCNNCTMYLLIFDVLLFFLKSYNTSKCIPLSSNTVKSIFSALEQVHGWKFAHKSTWLSRGQSPDLCSGSQPQWLSRMTASQIKAPILLVLTSEVAQIWGERELRKIQPKLTFTTFSSLV